jgi:hypothetical protein
MLMLEIPVSGDEGVELTIDEAHEIAILCARPALLGNCGHLVTREK